ncbi:CRTAC1 family protein, partial [Akkermansiaceae bacterium]|nr:CRTAC1 family protein [Akkermansiaceae bacterium]
PTSLPLPRQLRKFFFTRIIQVIIALIFSLVSASGDEIRPENAQKPSSSSGKPLSVTKQKAKEETSKSLFKQRLEVAYKRYPQELYSNRNAARADYIRRKLEASDNSGTANQALIYGEELLSAGKTQEAIQILEQTSKALREKGYGLDRNTKRFFDSLAMAYLRLGEDENCCAHYNEESCLFPIEGKAIHTNRRGSESAIVILKEILDSFPQDYQSRYLLNLAYMTLGEYPKKVPLKLLIPKMGLGSGFDFPKFPNIATSVGADTSGMSGGLCLEDFNNDGLIDVFSSSWGLEDNVTLLINTGKEFEERTNSAGLDGVVSGLNMIHADYDNDGDNDVFLLRGAWFEEKGRHPNSLLRNRGDGTFEDVTIEAGLYSENPTQTACWADFNNDGWLDLFIGNENKRGSKYRHPCELYLNQKDGTFKNIAKAAGVSVEVFAKGCAVADFNNDGWEDFYVSCLGEVNLLFENQGVTNEGIPRFRNVAQSAGVEEPLSSFPCWFFDYDNDGLQDIFVADFDPLGFSNMGGLVALEMMGKETEAEKPRLYKNRGNGTFEDVTRKKGLWRSMFAMGANFGDLNNDGYLDFYIGTGAPDFRMIVPNLMFLNDGGEKFSDVTVEGRFGNIQKGHAIGFGDLDNDGDQDVYAVMGGAVEGDTYHNLLFQNPGWENHWITLALKGKISNRSAVGALIRVGVIDKAGRQRYFYRRVGTGGSFGSSSLRQEIGLGACRDIKSVEVKWPNGLDVWEKIEGVKLDRSYKIVEGEETAKDWLLVKSSF